MERRGERRIGKGRKGKGKKKGDQKADERYVWTKWRLKSEWPCDMESGRRGETE